nr:murein transglycosylase [Amycolatopsis arida]
MVAGLVLVLTIGVNRDDEEPPPAEPSVEAPRPEPWAAAPTPAPAAPEDRLDASDQAELDAWAEQMATRTRVPARALAAYGRAEMWMRTAAPECRLSWGTLAAIGRVESQHGRLGGAEVSANGVISPPIVGPPLDGAPGVREIPDTDGGRLDGDTRWDRAVGPMQFLPATWARWSARASRDGAPPDPQNIDDAALTAARYLCASGGDLGSPDGWWTAVLTYNQSVGYAQDVFLAAETYATGQ